MNIADIRKDYKQRSLDLADLAVNPILQFKKWFEEALEAQVNEPNAMNLATASPQGIPSNRIVLLKGVDDRGFTFFTNYLSHKGQSLTANPFAALTFFWPELERQIRIEGKVTKLSVDESESYFNSRPRESQIGAWASEQSRPILNRNELENRFAQLLERYKNQNIPKPPHWGGFLIEPNLIEFWQGRPSRLHDRFEYKKQDNAWFIQRLQP